MPTRTITINGATWRVIPSGFVTQYEHDEFGLMFVTGSDSDPTVRVTRYSPQGTRSRDQAFTELSDIELRRLFDYSQPSTTSPEAGYRS